MPSWKYRDPIALKRFGEKAGSIGWFAFRHIRPKIYGTLRSLWLNSCPKLSRRTFKSIRTICGWIRIVPRVRADKT